MKVVCARNRNVIATVDEHANFLTWTIDSLDLEEVQRLVQTRLVQGRTSEGPRIKPEREQVKVELFSTDAGEYQVDLRWWGTLPAWCKRCGGHHLVNVVELRTAYWNQRRDVLVATEAVR
jgi:hypothetical protein